MEIKKTDRVFCPKCHSTDVECVDADVPEWISANEIGTKEYFECNACRHEFTILGGYLMGCFCFANDAYMDDRDIMMEYR